MKATIKIPLITREVYKLFERKIDSNRLFIDAILHKFNLVIAQDRQQPSNTPSLYHQLEQSITELTHQFDQETSQYTYILEAKNEFSDKKINFIEEFHPQITICNPLSIRLVEFIATYDKLIATLKLLRLADCFETDVDYYANIKRIQSLANRMLSNILWHRQVV